jgi:hypothetical protein
MVLRIVLTFLGNVSKACPLKELSITIQLQLAEELLLGGAVKHELNESLSIVLTEVRNAF